MVKSGTFNPGTHNKDCNILRSMLGSPYSGQLPSLVVIRAVVEQPLFVLGSVRVAALKYFRAWRKGLQFWKPPPPMKIVVCRKPEAASGREGSFKFDTLVKMTLFTLFCVAYGNLSLKIHKPCPEEPGMFPRLCDVMWKPAQV